MLNKRVDLGRRKIVYYLEHREMESGKIQFERKCRACPDLLFRTEKEYLLHIRDDHDGKIVECNMCWECGKTFRRRSELTQHIRSKCGTEKLFVCKECGQKLSTPGSYYNHIKRHKGEASSICSFCAKLFLTLGELKVHERKHTQQKDFVCNICNKGFCFRQSLITHLTLHTGIRPYQCEGCGKAYSCVGNLLRHRKTHKDTCGLLPNTSHKVQNNFTKIKILINTPESSKLKRAQMKKELDAKFAWLDKELEKNGTKDENQEVFENIKEEDIFIKEGFENEESLSKNCTSDEKNNDDQHTENNKRNCENSDLEKYENNIKSNEELNPSCEKKLEQMKNYSSHSSHEQEFADFIKERKLEKGKSVACKYCNKKYNFLRWLYKHEQDHIRNSATLPLKCACCKMGFETKEEVKEHQLHVHADILSCHDCDEKIFANMDSLRSHRQTFHKGIPRKEYIYICEKCGTKFKQKSLLNIHNKMNCSKLLHFQCQICQKIFLSHHSLKAHTRVHSSEKTLKCKFCDKKFRWKGQLKVHERSHTGEKPYTCLFCPSAFAYRDSLITHSTKHTGVKPYLCKCCGWRFSCIGNLIKHKVTHASTCGAWYKENSKEADF